MTLGPVMAFSLLWADWGLIYQSRMGAHYDFITDMGVFYNFITAVGTVYGFITGMGAIYGFFTAIGAHNFFFNRGPKFLSAALVTR